MRYFFNGGKGTKKSFIVQGWPDNEAFLLIHRK